jgi:hypothetical protein
VRFTSGALYCFVLKALTDAAISLDRVLAGRTGATSGPLIYGTSIDDFHPRRTIYNAADFVYRSVREIQVQLGNLKK